MAKPSVSRNTALDVARCLAFFSVISVHYFLNNQYYDIFLIGPRMLLHTILRSASMVCVPLFLLLSGYFLKNKRPDRNHYKKLVRLVCLYVMASGCCYFYNFGFTGNLFQFIRETLGFTAAKYAWYMNMYFGLFLLIPYLNILYNGLPSQNSKIQLIFTLLFLTSFISIANSFAYHEGIGWTIAVSTTVNQVLLPDWWANLYPITYYFLGSYLKDHPLPIKRFWNFLLYILVAVGTGILNFVLAQGNVFLHGPWQDWGSILNVAQSVLLFNLLTNMELKRFPKKLCTRLSRISGLTFSAFLVSYIFDSIVYRYLSQIQPSPALRLVYYPLTTFVIGSCSLLLSWVLDCIYDLLASGVSHLFSRGK